MRGFTYAKFSITADGRVRHVVPGCSVDEILEQATHHVYWRDVSEYGKTPFDELFELFDRSDVIVGYLAVESRPWVEFGFSLCESRPWVEFGLRRS
jgi:hypothetical protein